MAGGKLHCRTFLISIGKYSIAVSNFLREENVNLLLNMESASSGYIIHQKM